MDAEKLSEAQLLAREILTGDVLFTDIEPFLKPWVQVEDKAAALEKSLKNPDANDFDAGVIVAADMLRNGAILPDWLAVFAADVLEGKRKRPTKPGQSEYANWIRDYKIARAVFEVSVRFGMPQYTNSDTSRKLTAAEVVAESGQLSLYVVHHAIRRFGGEIERLILPQSLKN